MEAPSDAIETIGSLVWMTDGIVVTQAKGVPSTRGSVTELFDAVREVIDGTPRPLLFDARKWPRGDPEAWTTAISNFESTCTAIGMLIDPDSPAEVAGFPDVIDRLLIPFRIFTDEGEAVAFLRTHLGAPPE